MAAPIRPDRRPKPFAQRLKISEALKRYHARCREALDAMDAASCK